MGTVIIRKCDNALAGKGGAGGGTSVADRLCSSSTVGRRGGGAEHSWTHSLARPGSRVVGDRTPNLDRCGNR